MYCRQAGAPWLWAKVSGVDCYAMRVHPLTILWFIANVPPRQESRPFVLLPKKVSLSRLMVYYLSSIIASKVPLIIDLHIPTYRTSGRGLPSI